MTIIEALLGYYDRVVARGEAEPLGYSRENISYAIVLTPGGEVVAVDDIRGAPARRPRPVKLNVPVAVKRTAGIASNRLWDKTAYALGVTSGEGKRTAQEHEHFKAAHAALLSSTQDEGLLAVRRFLESWTPAQFAENPLFNDEMRDANIVFRMDGATSFIHDRPAAIALRTVSREGESVDVCLATGRRGTAARLHPSIMGVRGAQSSGASLVSFNLDAFTSYGKDQGANAPVSEEAARRYGAALNRLLDKGSRNRTQVGDTTMVYWSDARGGTYDAADAADAFAKLVLDPAAVPHNALFAHEPPQEAMRGSPAFELNAMLDPATRFYILGLAPNAARLSVRFWHDGTLGDLERRFREHWHDMSIAPPPKIWPPSAWHLLIESAALHRSENISPILGGELMRAILNGTRYPRSLMSAVIMRIRVEQGEVGAMRAAILRGILNRDTTLGFEQHEVPLALDETDTNTAYLLGRWFAELETIQQRAKPRLSATVRTRFYASASSMPACTFPLIIRATAKHLADLKREGRARPYEKRLETIIASLGPILPRSLRLEDQARFAIGYYHQRARRFTRGTNAGLSAFAGEETNL